MTMEEREFTDLEKVLAGLEGQDGDGDIGALVRGGEKDKQGVIHRIISAPKEDEDYRQALLLASFFDDKQSCLATAAVNECQRIGVPITPLINRMLAQCAIKSGRVEAALRGLTHQSFATNYKGGGKSPDNSKGKNSIT